MKKIIKILQNIISFFLHTLAIILFIPPILIYILYFFIDDPKAFIRNMKEMVKQFKIMGQTLGTVK